MTQIVLQLRPEKAGRFEKLLRFTRGQFIVTRSSVRLSRAPPHHTFHAFLNLNGIITHLTLKTIISDHFGNFVDMFNSMDDEPLTGFGFQKWLIKSAK